MVRNIILLDFPDTTYGVMNVFLRQFHEALLRANVDSKILKAKGEWWKEIIKEAPEFTLSMNHLTVDSKSYKFFPDFTQIPHVLCLFDHPLFESLYTFKNSPYSIITCVDRSHIDFFKQMDYHRAFFMPHATDPNLYANPAEKRPYDVVFFSTLIDCDATWKKWKDLYPLSFCKALDDAANLMLSTPALTHIDAFMMTTKNEIEKIDPAKIDLSVLIKELEDYIRAKSRIEIIKAIKETKIDIFGKSESTNTWKKFLKNQPNITVHNPVPYIDTFKIMRESKIIINSNPNMKYGGHERIFSTLLSGALTVTNETPYITEFFTDKINISLYNPKALESLDNSLQLYLKDEPFRQVVVSAGQEIVKQHHIWDKRVPGFLEFLNSIKLT